MSIKNKVATTSRHPVVTTFKKILLQTLIALFANTLTHGQSVDNNQKGLTILIAKALIDVQMGRQSIIL
jgi:hypothetical protein